MQHALAAGSMAPTTTLQQSYHIDSVRRRQHPHLLTMCINKLRDFHYVNCCSNGFEVLHRNRPQHFACLARSAAHHTSTRNAFSCQNSRSVREVSLQLNTQSFQVGSWKLKSSVWLTLPQSATFGMACLSKSTFHMQNLPSVVGSFCCALAQFFQLARGLNGLSVGSHS